MKKVLFALIALAASSVGLAQTAASPALTLVASPASGPAPLDTIVTWSTVPPSTSCQASGGTTTFTGQVGSGGSKDLTLTKTQSFGISCTWKANLAAPAVTVTWDAPTQNTNGTALTNLQGYEIFADTVNPPQKIAGTIAAGNSSFTVTSPPVGTDYFAVESVNASGVASQLSNVATLTVKAVSIPSITKVKSIAVTVTAATASAAPTPNSPANVSASE